jgi:two-component system, NtrC family, response regulator HydG
MTVNDPKGTILIVDDRIELSMTLADVLEESGYTVLQAADGYLALEQIRQSASPVDVAIVDIVMPGMNGVETFKEMKKISPETDVIMYTGFAVEELINEALYHGARAVVHKPFDLLKMIELIESCVRGAVVLIVDDDEEVRGTLKEILRERGYRISMAATGQEAIELVKEGKCNIVLLDVIMPGMNGEATLEQIHEIDPTTAVIMMTGKSVEDKIRFCLDRGAYGCLHKPYDPEKVVKLLGEIVARKEKNVSPDA